MGWGSKRLLPRVREQPASVECRQCEAAHQDTTDACAVRDSTAAYGPTVYFECRRCGTAIGAETASCPVCENESVAEYVLR